MSEFESHSVPLSYGLVPHLSKKLSKLPSLPADLPDYILYPQRAVANNFFTGWPTLTQDPCFRVHGRTSLLLQQFPACLVCLSWMIFEMGGKWRYYCRFVMCCFHGLFKIARHILVNSHLVFSLCILLAFSWWIHTVLLTQSLLGRNPVWFHQIDFLIIDNFLIAWGY